MTARFALNRREVLKVGLCAGAFLATAGVGASLSGCSSSAPADGFKALRASDLPFLQALVPVMLAPAGNAQAVQATLASLDDALNHLSAQMLKLTRQLFDVLAMPVTRGPLTGVWGHWENASSEQITQFLQRWQNSSLSLLRMGHSSLLQMVMMAWYGRAESWAQCGYPGPPKV
ncbi:MAG: twin-arginine translocation pathway signal protein [Pseudomonas sp.]|uniref:twin-arginine translocation pathway signal protein n=1 Tax=Pseudomonas abieticivorans TaxID=2931382 RepID=UPI0020BF5AC4|nr:twin-arginine translocation pathway signal protein [Pseudomonas sp. PIA16]MDE1168456.1 twin-arginine translocation pathway signal protein [Pseudomonas sp.]